ncbi:MAG: ECF transporter S component [bacterium]
MFGTSNSRSTADATAGITADSAARPVGPADAGSRPGSRWRTVDIVVVAVIAAVFGVVYWAFGLLHISTWLGVAAPLAGFTNALFLIAGPLAALIVRRPGAALAGELLAAIFEALVSVTWSGTSIVVYGVLEGLGAELVFLLLRYRRWNLAAALGAGALAGVAMVTLDLWIYDYYPTFSAGDQALYVAAGVLGGVVIAGGLGWGLVRALAATGVLSPFAAGREQTLV